MLKEVKQPSRNPVQARVTAPAVNRVVHVDVLLVCYDALISVSWSMYKGTSTKSKENCHQILQFSSSLQSMLECSSSLFRFSPKCEYILLRVGHRSINLILLSYSVSARNVNLSTEFLQQFQSCYLSFFPRPSSDQKWINELKWKQKKTDTDLVSVFVFFPSCHPGYESTSWGLSVQLIVLPVPQGTPVSSHAPKHVC